MNDEMTDATASIAMGSALLGICAWAVAKKRDVLLGPGPEFATHPAFRVMVCATMGGAMVINGANQILKQLRR